MFAEHRKVMEKISEALEAATSADTAKHDEALQGARAKREEESAAARSAFADATRSQQAVFDAVEGSAKEKLKSDLSAAYRGGTMGLWPAKGSGLPDPTGEDYAAYFATRDKEESDARAAYEETVSPARHEFETTTADEKKVLDTAIAEIEEEYAKTTAAADDVYTVATASVFDSLRVEFAASSGERKPGGKSNEDMLDAAQSLYPTKRQKEMADQIRAMSPSELDAAFDAALDGPRV